MYLLRSLSVCLLGFVKYALYCSKYNQDVNHNRLSISEDHETIPAPKSLKFGIRNDPEHLAEYTLAIPGENLLTLIYI